MTSKAIVKIPTLLDVMEKITSMGQSLENKIQASADETLDFLVAIKKDLDRMDARVGSIDNRLADVEGLAAKNEYHFHQLDLQMNKRFDQVDKKFEEIDKRFEQVDKRFEQVDQRFEQVDRRFEQVDKRFDKMDKRFDRLEVVVFPKSARRLSIAV